jgi:hypothetical protein
MEKVASILSEVQRIPSASNKLCIPKLNKVLQAESVEGQKEILRSIWRGCLDQCLLCSKKEHVIDKMVEFFVTFVSTKATIDLVFNSYIEHLLERSKAINKNTRLRACQMILCVIISASESGKEIFEDTVKMITDVLTSRLKDKVPGVRVCAVKIIGILLTDGDGMLEKLLKLLQSDNSKDVRVAAVEYIRLTKFTLPFIIARVKDVRPEVRTAVYARLSIKKDSSAKVKKMQSRSYYLKLSFLSYY